MRVLACGEDAVLLDCADLDDARRHHAAVLDRAEVVEAVLGARTVLLRGDPPALRHLVRALKPADDPTPLRATEHEIEVVYDGDDLAEVARLTGLGADEVVAAHGGTPWTVAFGGFAPGFAYLVGGDPRLVVPRKDTPRARVPRGSVGLAGEFSGIYPRESPGGWQLLGRTDAVLFDADRTPAALLAPGDTVRFLPADPEVLTTTPGVSRSGRQGQQGGGVRVVEPGALTLVQDDGRPGLAAQGVGRAGAFDRRAAAHARALVGDDPDLPGGAVLEVLGGGLQLEAEADHVVAVTGGVGPVTLDGSPAEHGRPLVLRAGQRLGVGVLAHGLRAYVAVAGGIDAPTTLGSRSTDTLSGLGPAPLATGDALDVGLTDGAAPRIDDVPSLLTPGTTVVDVVLGPRDDWFTPAAVATLLSTGWSVSARSDRIGVRLDGPALERGVDGELASEPCVRGSVQVTSAGLPVVLGPDHPVTGGYPVIGVVTGDGVDRLAQVRPGETVRFRRHRAR